MSAGKMCPACGEDIGTWAVFSAGLPNRISCPHCGARLRYRDAGGLLLIVLTAAGVLAIGAYLAARAVSDAGRAVQILLAVGVILGAWVPIELAVAWFLRNHRELVAVAGTPTRVRDNDAAPGGASGRGPT